MGDWAKFEFERETLPKRWYLFAGDLADEWKENILSLYENIKFHKHTVYERYIVSNGTIEELLLFQVYGAAAISDLTYILKDGGVEEIIFIGIAYGMRKDIEIGTYIIPDKVQALDGLINTVFGVEYSIPNELIRNSIKQTLDINSVKYVEGKSVSVPSTFFHPSKEKFDDDLVALEMEFSAVCYLSEELNMKCGGALIISDNEEHSLLEDKTLLDRNWFNLFKILKKHFDELDK